MKKNIDGTKFWIGFIVGFVLITTTWVYMNFQEITLEEPYYGHLRPVR